MDALADLLDGVRARGALFSQSIMAPPWAVRFENRSPLSVATMVRGRGWVVPAQGEPVALGTGDVAIVRGPEPYTVADRPDTRPTCLVHGAGLCTGPEGEELDEGILLGTRTYGERPDAPDRLLGASYEVGGEVSRRLLSALPDVLVVPADDCHRPVTSMIAEEVVCRAPGQQVVLDRLLDLALISTLRAWFDRPGTRAPSWYAAMGDPVVGRALRLLHDDPARPWTVAALADGCGVSRASLARRFTSLVGEPPMAYLTGWRIARAADLLRGGDATVASIARSVGYANTFALSVAFKRLRGVSPTEYRRAIVAA
ncbi:AraC family transcriptional regulator [Nocardiopsis sp. NPDC101807]|uniref:AraC family transcriptional regulator n=1 Tax=Nocardiopsis sp. NPDC101807 TaxID=3364339 RepID=UPI003824755E